MPVLEARALIESEGPTSLVLDDLVAADLPEIGWSGPPSHVLSVSRQLDRVPSGEVEYMAVRLPDGRAVAKGGVDFAAKEGVGFIWQLCTHPALRGLGIGTVLIGELERRIRRRGCPVAMLSVDQAGPRSQALYERLGYQRVGERMSGWQVTRPDGSVGWYEAKLTDLRKALD